MVAGKVLLFAAALSAANARYFGPNPGAVQYAPAAYTADQSNILRTPGNLGQLSTHQKSIQTPYSSVQKTDVRASNDALAYAAPAPAPAYARVPAAYAPAPAAPAGVVGASLLGVVYSPSTSVAHISYTNPNDRVNYAY